ncbi:MAG: hypothetical protein HOV79_17700 [Hamadaea sp.]|nr:hypothetical protein [Hamadaea sp.]
MGNPLRTGWVPAVVAFGCALAILTAYDTPVGAILGFTAYILLGLAVPGMLWYRWARGRSGFLGEDLAMGLAIGVCCQILTYLPFRAIGLPAGTFVWSIATIAVFASSERLRRLWRGSGRRMPLWYAWLLAATVVAFVVYSANQFFWSHGVSGGISPYVDMPFHLALAGELKNHAVPSTPYVLGESLKYHWFAHAHAAATSWATGIELQVLLLRLLCLPMLVGTVILVAAAARRLTRAWWPAALTVFFLIFQATPNPFPWIDNAVFGTKFVHASWTSPTSLLGLLACSAITVLLVDLLIGGDRLTRLWMLAVPLVLILAGAKGSQLPILFSGALGALIATAVLHRRLDRVLLIATGMLGSVLALGMFVVYGGSDGGATVRFLGGVEVLPIVTRTGLLPEEGTANATALLVALGIWMVLLSTMWAGGAGLFRRGLRKVEPAALYLFFCLAAAFAVAALLRYAGNSQLYFLSGAAGLAAVLAAVGLARAVPRGIVTREAVVVVAAGVATGTCAMLLTRALVSDRGTPSVAQSGEFAVLAGLLRPTVMLPVTLILLGTLAFLAVRRHPRRAALVLPGVLIAAMATTLPDVWQDWRPAFRLTAAVQPEWPAIPAEAVAAARWLRSESSADDVVATNLHCLDHTSDRCDARHFWVAAFTERRILVEGWAYTRRGTGEQEAAGVDERVAPFWNTQLLTDNDAAFVQPTKEAALLLRRQYGVRWLFADLKTTPSAAGLTTVAVLRYRAGDFAVFDLAGLA